MSTREFCSYRYSLDVNLLVFIQVASDDEAEDLPSKVRSNDISIVCNVCFPFRRKIKMSIFSMIAIHVFYCCFGNDNVVSFRGLSACSA